MKVVALVSGGKDSCFAMMRAIDYGHEIVALANLIPLDDNIDELNSYMYQTAGHQIIISYAQCMGLPLFRRRIHGTSREVGADYKMTAGDEVEDMYAILQAVKNRLPGVNAVCSGAIMSDYQRVRVESVCSRLGLISLAYLWKQDQTLLLEEMIRRGIVAITVKVAAAGLNPSEHLGKELKDLKSHLLKLEEKFGINVCGEGGEYESLTLDCPLFHNARIIIDKYDKILDSTDSVIAPVGVLHPVLFHLEEKNNSLSYNNTTSNNNTSSVYEVNENPVQEQKSDLDFKSGIEIPVLNSRISLTGKRMFSIGCWIDRPSRTSSDDNLQEDLSIILTHIETKLKSENLTFANVLYVHLYISNMKNFTLANEIYVKYITSEKCTFGVPSRSTIEMPLTESNLGNAYVEVLICKDSGANLKKVLHVQSISCWAPSCIGPYSQATKYNKVLYMAGQLGLDPPTMNICTGGPINELNQALLNSEAVALCFKSSIYENCFAFIIYCSVNMTMSERILVQERLEGINCGPGFLYILAPDLPKGASVELKPIIYIPDPEETEYQEIKNIKESQVKINEINLDESCYKIHNMNGELISAIVSITDKTASKICENKFEIKTVALFCASLVSKILRENNFSFDDLSILRFYYPAKLNSSGVNMNAIFSGAFSELAKVDKSVKIYNEPFFNLVPVLGSGQTASMDDVITFELFASKL